MPAALLQATVTTGLAASLYARYESVVSPSAAASARPTILKTDVRLALAFGSTAATQAGGAAPIFVIDFEVGKDGLLAAPAGSLGFQLIGSSSRDIGLEAQLKRTGSAEAGVELISGKATSETTIDTSYGFLAESRVAASQSLIVDREMKLTGDQVTTGDGRPQWRPYSLGVAFVVGMKAMMYSLTIAGSSRPLTYRLVPIDGSIEEHLVLFPLNPYVHQGTLDGWDGETGAPNSFYPTAKSGVPGHSYFKKLAETNQLVDDLKKRAAEIEATLPALDKDALVKRSLVGSYKYVAAGAFEASNVETSSVSEASVGGSFNIGVKMGFGVEAEVGIEGVAKASATPASPSPASTR